MIWQRLEFEIGYLFKFSSLLPGRSFEAGLFLVFLGILKKIFNELRESAARLGGLFYVFFSGV
jgi:hypothetical protein